MSYISINKKGQFWYVDFIIGLLIFLMALSVYTTYSSSDSSDSSLQSLVSDAKTVSSYLVGTGYPLNWSAGDVVIIGLANENSRINNSKVAALQNIDYDEAKKLLNTRHDFFVYFRDKTNCVMELGSGEYGYGHEDADLDNAGSSNSCFAPSSRNMTLNLSDISPKKVVKIERLVIYNSTIAKLIVHEWLK